MRVISTVAVEEGSKHWEIEEFHPGGCDSLESICLPASPEVIHRAVCPALGLRGKIPSTA
jgi:hypothetical protein